jgi:hypothetical protein
MLIPYYHFPSLVVSHHFTSRAPLQLSYFRPGMETPAHRTPHLGCPRRRNTFWSDADDNSVGYPSAKVAAERTIMTDFLQSQIFYKYNPACDKFMTHQSINILTSSICAISCSPSYLPSLTLLHLVTFSFPLRHPATLLLAVKHLVHCTYRSFFAAAHNCGFGHCITTTHVIYLSYSSTWEWRCIQ